VENYPRGGAPRSVAAALRVSWFGKTESNQSSIPRYKSCFLHGNVIIMNKLFTIFTKFKTSKNCNDTS
jgi:hypothetical protein